MVLVELGVVEQRFQAVREGDLKPGTYTVICGALLPDLAVYFGTGLTVSE